MLRKVITGFAFSKDVELMDTPGILWPKLADQHQARILASLSSIKEEILDKEKNLRVFFILKRNE